MVTCGLRFFGRIGDRRKGARFFFDAYRGLIERQPVTLAMRPASSETPSPPPQLPVCGITPWSAFERLTLAYRGCDCFVAPSNRARNRSDRLLEADGA